MNRLHRVKCKFCLKTIQQHTAVFILKLGVCDVIETTQLLMGNKTNPSRVVGVFGCTLIRRNRGNDMCVVECKTRIRTENEFLPKR
jgi:hypothetical protein